MLNGLALASGLTTARPPPFNTARSLAEARADVLRSKRPDLLRRVLAASLTLPGGGALRCARLGSDAAGLGLEARGALPMSR